MTSEEDSSGLLDRSRVCRLEMTGADRVRFLNGRVTCDVQPLAPGEGTYGFMTQVKGRILADVKILVLEESLWLELPPEKGEEIAEYLAKYVIVEDVEIRPLDRVSLSLIGSRAAAILDDADLPGRPYSHRPVRLFDVEALVAREVDTGTPGSPVPVRTLWVPEDESASLRQKLLEEGGLRPVGAEAWERLRVESGRPLYGQDYGFDNFPQETGLEDAVSYTKGCYLGQEVVARIHYRGGVNKLLRGLRFASMADPLGKAVLEGGRQAGVVTSAVDSPALGPIGLSVIHKRVEPGTRVEIEGAGAVDVVRLPFEPLEQRS